MASLNYEIYPNPSKSSICSRCNTKITDKYRAAKISSSYCKKAKENQESGWHTPIRGGWMHVSCASKPPNVKVGRRRGGSSNILFEDKTRRKEKKRKRQSVCQITNEMIETLDRRENPPDAAKESRDWAKNCKCANNAVIIEALAANYVEHINNENHAAGRHSKKIALLLREIKFEINKETVSRLSHYQGVGQKSIKMIQQALQDNENKCSDDSVDEFELKKVKKVSDVIVDEFEFNEEEPVKINKFNDS